MKKFMAFVVALIWCLGLSWLTHEIYLDMLTTSGFGTAWAMSAFLGMMNLATTFLIYFFIAHSRDF